MARKRLIGWVKIILAGAGVLIFAASAGALTFRAVDDMAVDDQLTVGGNVGIGTTAPAALLDIGGGTATNIDGTDDLLVKGDLEVDGTIYGDGSGLTNVGSGAIADDSLDWAKFADAMTLDATTTIDMDTSAADLNFDSGTLFIDSSTSRVGIGTTAPGAKLEVAGDITLSGSGTTITTANTELVLEQTGDTYGTTRLRLRNRTGSNGAIFDSPSLDLVDFGFLPSSGIQNNFRLEHRSSYLVHSGNTDGEFQFIGPSGTWSKWFASGRSATIIREGNVGIGTTNPSAKLDVVGDLEVSGTITQAGSGLIDGSGTASYLSKWSDSNTLTDSVAYDDGTNIGIGTTAPGKKLDIIGNARIGNTTPYLYLKDIDSGAGTGGIIWQKSNDGTGASMLYSSGNLTFYNNMGGDLIFSFAAGASGVERVRMKYGGSVGIGDAGPDAWLEISDSGGGSTDLFMLSSDDNNDGDLFIVKNSGNVGIGTTSPSAKLDVQGAVTVGADASGYDVTFYGTSSGDYVRWDASANKFVYSGNTQPKRTIVLTAQGAVTPSSGGAKATKTGTNITYYQLEFDKNVDESAYWEFVIPDSLAATTADVYLYWSTASTSTTENVLWKVQSLSVGAGDAVDGIPGTAISQTAASAGQGLLNVTNVGSLTTTGWAGSEYTVIKVFRDADDVSDTLNEDADLLMVKLEWSANSNSD